MKLTYLLRYFLLSLAIESKHVLLPYVLPCACKEAWFGLVQQMGMLTHPNLDFLINNNPINLINRLKQAFLTFWLNLQLGNFLLFNFGFWMKGFLWPLGQCLTLSCKTLHFGAFLLRTILFVDCILIIVYSSWLVCLQRFESLGWIFPFSLSNHEVIGLDVPVRFSLTRGSPWFSGLQFFL